MILGETQSVFYVCKRKRKAKRGKTTPQLMWRITRDDERSVKQMCVKSKIMFVCTERKRRDVCRAIPGYRKGIRFTSYGEHPPTPPLMNYLFSHFCFSLSEDLGQTQEHDCVWRR